MDTRIKIAVVDDHPIVLKGLVTSIERTSNFELVLAAQNGKDLLEQMRSNTPDVVLLDIQMPVMDGYKTLPALLKVAPETKVVMFSFFFDRVSVRHFIRAGASAYLCKDSHYEEIVYAIKAVYDEGYYYSENVLQALDNNAISNGRCPLEDVSFTERELEVLKLLSMNYTNESIAQILSISLRTVEWHRQNLLRKSGATNLAAVVVYATAHNLIPGTYQHHFLP